MDFQVPVLELPDKARLKWGLGSYLVFSVLWCIFFFLKFGVHGMQRTQLTYGMNF